MSYSNNEFILKLIALLDQQKSKSQINTDIKEIEKSIRKLRLTATIIKVSTKNELNQVIKQLESQLRQIKLQAKVDNRQLNREINKALRNVSARDINLNFNSNGERLNTQVRRAVAQAREFVERNPISVNIDLKRKKLLNQLTAFTNKNTKINESSYWLREVERLRTVISSVTNRDELRNATDQLQVFTTGVRATGYAAVSTTDRIKGMLGNVIKISNYFGLAFVAVNKFRQSLNTLKTNDSILVEISKTSEMTKQQLKELGDEAFKVASKYGQVSGNYLLAVQEMARSGYEMMSRELAELSLLAQSAGDMTADSANNYLLATDAAYKYSGSVEKLNTALDGANYISNKNSASLTDIADATRVSASFAANAGIAIDELTAAEATMIAVTKRSGSEIGRAFRSIILNLQGVSGEFDGEVIDEQQLQKVEARCHSLGVELEYMKDGVATLRNPMDVLRELAEVYNSLPDNSAEKQGLISDLAGKYHANSLSALLSRWDMYEKMLGEFSQGTGSALEEAEKTANSWEGRLNALSNSWDSFVNTLTNKNTIMDGISFFDRLIQGAETLTNTIGEIPLLLTTLNTAMVAMKKDYGITKIWDQDKGKVDIQGNLLGIDFSAIKEQKKHFKDTEDAISIWNNKVKNGKDDLEAFNYAVVQNNEQLKKYLSTTSKDAPASLSGYRAFLQKAGISTDALRFKTILLNSAISMGIGVAIQAALQGLEFAVKGIDDYIHRVDRAIEKGKEARDNIKSLSDTMKDTESSAKSLTQSYEKLAKYVDDVSNADLDLSSDEYKEFVDINQDILDLFPSLNRVYDANGNAMVKLKDSTQSLSEVLAELIEIQRKATLKNMADELPAAFNGAIAEVGVLNKQLGSAKAQLDVINSIEFDENGIFTIDLKSNRSDAIDPYNELFGKIGITPLPGGGVDEVTGEPIVRLTIRAEDLEIDGNDNRSPEDIIKAKLNEELGVITLEETGIEQQIKESWGNLNQSLYAYMSTENARFMAMSDEKQNAIQQMLSGINWTNIKDIDNWNDAYNYINNNIMEWMSDFDISSKLIELFSIDESKVSTKEYLDLVDNICKEISAKTDKDPAQIKAELNLNEDYDSLARERTSFLIRMDGHGKGKASTEAAENFYDGLTSSERDIANSKDFEDAIKSREKALGHVINSVNDYNKVLNDMQKAEQKVVFTKSDMIDSINELSDGFDILDEIYADVKDGNTKNGKAFDFTNLNTKKFQEAFKGLEDEYTEFIETVSANPTDIKACQDAFNKLTTAYVGQSEALKNLNRDNADVAANMLKNMGIKNAEDIIQKKLIANEQVLSNKEEALAAATEDMGMETSVATDEFIKQSKASKLAKIELADLIATENIFSKKDMNTSDKVKELNKVALSYFKIKDAIQICTAMGNDPRYWNSPEDYEKAVEDAWNKLVEQQQEMIFKFDYTGADKSSKAKTKDKDSSKKSKSASTKTEINWLERRLTRMQDIIDLTKAKLQNLFSVDKRQNNISKQIEQTTKLIKQYEIAADRYTKKAKKVAKASTVKEDGKKKKVPALSKDIIQKIKSGKITKGSYNNLIKKYGKNYADKINEYIDYYDKAQNAEKSAEEKRAEKRQLKKDKIQVKVDDYESNVSLLEQKKENAATASKKNDYLNKEKDIYNDIYKQKIKIAKLDKDDVEVQRLKAEQAAKEKEIEIEKHQNNIDEFESQLDLLSAQKENALSAADKIRITDEEIAKMRELYAEKKALAELEGNTEEVQRLDEEQKSEEKQSVIDKSDYIKDEYDNKLAALDREEAKTEARIKKNEALGIGQSKKDYAEQIKLSEKRKNILAEKRNSLEAYLEEQIALGNVVRDDNEPAYRQMMDSINECDTGIADCVTEQINYNKAIRDMDLKNYESLISLLERGSDVYKRYKSLADIHGSELSDDEMYKQIELNDRIINTARKANEERANNIKKALMNDYTDAFGFNFTEEQADKFIKTLENAPELLPDFMESLGIEDFNEERFKDLFEDINDFCTQEDAIFQKMGDNENLVDELYGNRINWINEYLDALKKEKDIKDRTLAIEKAQYELNKAKNNLTKKVWDGQQWVYTADTDAIQSAQESLDNAQYEKLINVLDNLIDFLEKYKKDINLYDDHGNEINSVEDIKKENENLNEIDRVFKDMGIDLEKVDFKKALENLPNVVPPLSFKIPNFEVPNVNNISSNISNNNPINIQKVEIIMPNITNESTAKDLMNELSSLGTYAKQYNWNK